MAVLARCSSAMASLLLLLVLRRSMRLGLVLLRRVRLQKGNGARLDKERMRRERCSKAREEGELDQELPLASSCTV